jgi:PadR family transcriptional regulator, regulatory protein AphA
MMNYQAVTRENQTYIEACPDGALLAGEREAMELIEACAGCQTHRILLTAANLPEDFYNLKTGIAGQVLQKFAMYRMRVAAILTPELVGTGRFSEMVLEANRGSIFRVFYDREKAEQWLFRD